MTPKLPSQIMEDLFTKIRSTASPQLWSKAVETVRKELVSGLSSTPSEIAFRVSASQGGLSSEVTLTFDDLDWLCSCGSDDDPCFHVAAAVIALKRAQEKGEAMPVSTQLGGRIVYQWKEVGNLDAHSLELKLERRVLYPDGQTKPLNTKIAAMVAGRVPNPGLSATPEDVEIDLQLIQYPQLVYSEEDQDSPRRDLLSGQTPFPTALVQKSIISILKALKRMELTAFLDSSLAKTHYDAPVSLEVIVRDEGPGVKIFSQQDSDIIKIYKNYLALCHSGIRPFWIPQMNLHLREILKNGRIYGPRDFPELVGEVLPPLKEVLPLVIQTKKLPGVTYAEPFLDLVITRDPSDPLALISEVKILYKIPGEGVVASIDHGKLVSLKEGVPVPTRNISQELLLRDMAVRKFGRELGQKSLHRGKEAIDLMNSRPITAWESKHKFDHNFDDFKLFGTLSPQIRVDDREFTIAFEIRKDASSSHPTKDIEAGQIGLKGQLKTADPLHVFQAYQKGDVLVPLTGGGWGEIPVQWLKKHADELLRFFALKDQVDSRREHRPLAGSQDHIAKERGELALPLSGQNSLASLPLLSDLSLFIGNLGIKPPPILKSAEQAVHRLIHPPESPLPADLSAHLRHYQKEGYDWLCQIAELGVGALLCDEMGLGKTLQAIAAMRGNTLIVAPASVVPNWCDEIKKFRPETPVNLYHGPGRALSDRSKLTSLKSGSNPADVTPRPQVTLTTFATLRTDLQKLSPWLWDTIIIDEGQNIKNPTSQIAQAVHSLKGRFRILLTGTPVENRLEDLWSQMHFANPNLFCSLKEFRQTYRENSKPESVNPNIENASTSSWQKLRQKLKPYMKRRLKKEVAPDLPSKTETIRYVELSSEERNRYETLRLATREDLLKKMGVESRAMLALEGLLRLRQAACHSSLIPGFLGVESDERPYQDSSKLQVLIELLEESVENGHKVLVFSQWTSFLRLIAQALDFHKISFTTLTGETKDRMKVVNEFQDPEGPSTLLISLKAGGVGLNLTAADHVIFVDPWWNPAVEDQAIDRTHRIGQTKPILIQRLVALGTVEEKILTLKELKKGLARGALADSNLPLPVDEDLEELTLEGLSSEEMLALLD